MVQYHSYRTRLILVAGTLLSALLLAPAAWADPAEWAGLDPAQRAVLAPVAGQWDQLPDDSKATLMRVARRYENLSPEQQDRVRDRIGQWASMSHEERERARENYRKFKAMSPAQRQQLIQHTNATTSAAPHPNGAAHAAGAKH
ncbi:DUF3106 domain-containing protein [Silvimonas iriomotensis]|uniref:DUF3106 domain-containing protein n=1 Tax=Silvimonas iriomotensis TaxID=449662 RepID=A0ABQ2PAZ2_9NEIS|nr:DUF3106 domain-containing protein [Silvimonas iriomotensis]GGP22152.1 hypothetical protein GCM10010970_23810 [Silvimonas iriomotensis]